MNLEITTPVYLILGLVVWAILYTRSQKKIKLVIDLLGLAIWIGATIIYGWEIIKQYWPTILIIISSAFAGLFVGWAVSKLKKSKSKTPTG